MQETESRSTDSAQLQFGSYRVLHPLGVGGMSSVYRAVHVQTGHEVALKVLPLALAKNPIVLQRFLREARSAESLEHPNIVSIYDRGTDQGRHYLVLEYVRGNDLHEYVQIRGPLSAGEAITVVRQIAEGLRFAAARGLVHRDIKPSNILRSESGEIKITDLGLALHTKLEDERVTREGTTVGTVDYMAPEQARDSRAASLQSDLYSLGCTLYYLLTGIPPFPGGDIIDKLTRHAKSPPPDVRDLRPDVPPALSEIMLRMMSKLPEDRFANFEQLIAALDKVPIDADARVPGVALMPLDTDRKTGLDRPPVRGKSALAVGEASRPPSSIPEISLANLPADLIEDEPAGTYVHGQGTAMSAGVLPRLTNSGLLPRSNDQPIIPARKSGLAAWSTRTWVSVSVALALTFIVSVIAIDRLVRSSPPDMRNLEQPVDQPGTGLVEPPGVEPERPAPPSVPAPSVAKKVSVRPPDVPAHPASAPAGGWVEPRDPEPAPARASPYTDEALKKYLPGWALLPVPSRVEGPLLQVRRVPGSRDPSTFPTLRLALDETRGTIEIADQGPLLINDFRVPGETRLIRAREGFRPIIRIERPLLQVVRDLPGVIVLDGKNLILDSLDIIINLRDLPPRHSCLFDCIGADLTVRNCTITLVDPGREPFALVRARGSNSRGSRVRFERTFVRGLLSSGFELGAGAVDVAIRETVVLGSQGPIIRSREREKGVDHRVSVVGGVLACRGPAIDLVEQGAEAGPKSRPLVVRAFDSVFGRFQGAAIASVIASTNPSASPRDMVDWLGQQNLFCGWIGFYASGKEPTVRIPSLSAFRSTWNQSDQSSLEIPVPWLQPPHLSQVTADVLAPFIPGREAALSQTPVPRPYLTAQTIWSFPVPIVPLPLVLVQGEHQEAPRAINNVRHEVHAAPKAHGLRNTNDQAGPGRPGESTTGDLLFDADSAEWQGDLGAFLREKITAQVKHARVRVVGSGPHRASPVRLPDGVVLELRVEGPSKPEAEWLSWSPAPESQGRALIELHGGTLVLTQLRLRADESAAVGSLVHVEDGNLVLYLCQLICPAHAEIHTSRLITYQAASTRPYPRPPGSALFASPPDRPVCILGDCTLITEGAAIQALLGKGLIGMNQTAIAAGTNALELLPADVARGRFECDLVLDRCTLASQSNIIRLGRWPGAAPGPDRPLLITTKCCAFLGSYDRRVFDTVLLRVDENSMAGGTVFWQGKGDAAEVDAFTAADTESFSGRTRDVVHQWVNFWGNNHLRDITGPRTGVINPSVRLSERLKPGRIEPADLILDAAYHPGVGADLARQGITRRTGAGGRRR
jgi:eukaryotic-like serine/threonine-protein kinase